MHRSSAPFQGQFGVSSLQRQERPEQNHGTERPVYHFIFFILFNLKASSLKRRLLFVRGFQQSLLCEGVYHFIFIFIFYLKVPSLKQRLLLMRRHLSDGYENSRRLIDACSHIYKKKMYPCDFW